MLSNNVYNLLEQIVEESKSLWRIRQSYKQDAGAFGDCLNFWNKLEMDKEQHINDLRMLIKSHLE